MNKTLKRKFCNKENKVDNVNKDKRIDINIDYVDEVSY